MSGMIEGSATNRTKSGSHILLYNSVPKAGSVTMITLLKRLKIVNHFTVKQDREWWK